MLEDPDAPKPFPNPFIHWVVYKNPAFRCRIERKSSTPPRIAINPRSTPGKKIDPAGKKLRRQDRIHRHGPPTRPRRIIIISKLYALDTTLDIVAGIDRDTLKAIMTGHIIEEAHLVGTLRKMGRRQSHQN